MGAAVAGGLLAAVAGACVETVVWVEADWVGADGVAVVPAVDEDDEDGAEEDTVVPAVVDEAVDVD